MKMNKVMGLVLVGMLSVGMVGCGNNNIDNQVQEKQKQQEQIKNESEKIYEDKEVMEIFINKMFKINYYDESSNSEREIHLLLGTVLNELYNGISYSVSYQGDFVYNVQVINKNNGEFITFNLNMETKELEVIRFVKEDVFYEGMEAEDAFTELIIEYHKNKENQELEKEELVPKEDVVKEKQEEVKPPVEKKQVSIQTENESIIASPEQKQALKKAEQYIDLMGFSKEGLRDQLEYEGFENESIEYAIENVVVNWNEEALEKAEQYMDLMGFSKEGMRGQLEYDGFTDSEIEYAIDRLY